MNEKPLQPLQLLFKAMQTAFIRDDPGEKALACREWEIAIHARNVYAMAAKGVDRESVEREKDPDTRACMREACNLSQWWTPETLLQLHVCQEFAGRKWIRAEVTLAHDIEMERSVGSHLLTEIREQLAVEEERARERLRRRAFFEEATIILAEDFLNGTITAWNAGIKTKTATENYVFSHKGDYWQIVYDGLDLGLFKRRTGLTYIHNLLSHPRESIPIQEMRNIQDKMAAPAVVTPTMPMETKSGREYGFGGHIRKLADPSFNAAVLRLQAELQDKLSREKDVEEHKKIACKLSQLAGFLRLAGKRGCIGSVKFNLDEPADLRRNVRSCIRDAIDMFTNSDVGRELAEHLQLHVETGASCRYAGDLPWRI